MSLEQEKLIRIETKLDVLIMSDRDKEDRLRKLESMSARIYGIGLVLSIVASVLVSLLLKAL